MFGDKKRPFRGKRAMDEVRPSDIQTAVSKPVLPSDDATSWMLVITGIIAITIPVLVMGGPQIYAAIIGH